MSKAAQTREAVLHARGGELAGAIPASIQIFPPGDMEVTPSGADGKPVTVRMRIGEATAGTMEASRAAYQAAADLGEGDAPFIDFNHDDGPAAGWPKRIFWGGDDAAAGGVRAELEWSEAGRDAVTGKLYRRFSPAFVVALAKDGSPDLDAEGFARITGAPVNMGGLVNRAAFRNIQALFSRGSGAQQEPNQTTTDMNEEEAAAVKAENEDLKSQLAELRKELEALRKDKAGDAVELAAKEGRIAPGAELRAKWVKSLLADPAAAELLAGLPVNPALKAKLPESRTEKTPAKPEDAQPTGAELVAKFAKLPREERGEFYAKHKETLQGALNG